MNEINPKITGYLNGLDYNTEDRNAEGHAVLRKMHYQSLCEIHSNKKEVDDAFKVLEIKGAIKLTHDWQENDQDVIGYITDITKRK